MRGVPFLHRLDAHDRALLARWAIGVECPGVLRWFWCVITHCGGATFTITLAILPFVAGSPVHHIGVAALVTLACSHTVVHIIKRRVGRPRPSLGVGVQTLINEPDRFSFPSGHAAAAMSIAISYAVAFPSLALPLLGLAIVVGASRVYLGVHYPGDVLMGQTIAVTVSAVFALARSLFASVSLVA